MSETIAGLLESVNADRIGGFGWIPNQERRRSDKPINASLSAPVTLSSAFRKGSASPGSEPGASALKVQAPADLSIARPIERIAAVHGASVTQVTRIAAAVLE